MKRKVTYILAFCAYIAAILVLCLMKPDELPQTDLFIFGLPADKVAHFAMFLPFPVLFHMMFFDRTRKRWQELLILVSGIALGIGAALGTEALQAMTQYRSSDIKDVYADATGLGLGSLIALTHILVRKRRS